MEELEFDTIPIEAFPQETIELEMEELPLPFDGCLALKTLPRHNPRPANVIEKTKGQKGGRPTVMKNDTLQKLRMAYLVDASDREACVFAGISLQTLYNYQHNNPEFLEQKQGWKLNLGMLARLTVARAIQTDPNLAWKYLERKFPQEYGNYCLGCKNRIGR
ncbi:hypothetical protein K8Q94_00335 [Candidatus Nomurabacteria bacterium]|nr:hypothetical protein [Candidatus Nomurabacteria bacterium]